MKNRKERGRTVVEPTPTLEQQRISEVKRIGEMAQYVDYLEDFIGIHPLAKKHMVNATAKNTV